MMCHFDRMVVALESRCAAIAATLIFKPVELKVDAMAVPAFCSANAGMSF